LGKRGRRRIWTDGEKRMICAQTRLAGVSVSQVARRYDVNTNLVFTWLRDPRFAGTAEDETPSFLPVEVVGAAPAPAVRAAAEGRVEIDLAGGVRLRVVGGYDPEALARLIRGLSG